MYRAFLTKFSSYKLLASTYQSYYVRTAFKLFKSCFSTHKKTPPHRVTKNTTRSHIYCLHYILLTLYTDCLKHKIIKHTQITLKACITRYWIIHKWPNK